MILPESYVIHKFYQHAGYPRYKRVNSTYEAGCPICREGSSWGRKRRLYYIPKKNIICCHNCGWYGDAAKWIQEVEHITYSDMMKQLEDGEYDVVDISKQESKTSHTQIEIPSLPHDSINLFNSHQLDFYKSNPVLKKAKEYIKSRRLDTACNAPSSLYLSLTDKVHKNRLCIPSYNRSGKIVHYQTRKLLDDDSPKYLSKTNSEKSVFGIDQVTDLHHTIYIFEGPIDSFFVENSIAIAGIQESGSTSLTDNQSAALQEFCTLKKVWVLDNQSLDSASKSKSRQLATNGESVFIWPKNCAQFKDFNDMCMHYKLDCISNKFIDSNVATGPEAILKLSN